MLNVALAFTTHMYRCTYTHRLLAEKLLYTPPKPSLSLKISMLCSPRKVPLPAPHPPACHKLTFDLGGELTFDLSSGIADIPHHNFLQRDWSRGSADRCHFLLSDSTRMPMFRLATSLRYVALSLI